MPKYMLSVPIDPAEDVASLPKEEQEQSGADVDAVNDALAESGSGVRRRSRRDRVRHDCGRARRCAGDHRRPVLRVEGVPRRVLDHRGRRPRRQALEWARRGSKACRGRIEVRPFDQASG